MSAKKSKTSFTLSEDAMSLLRKLSQQYGLSASSTIEFIIRDRAGQLGITVD